MIVKVMTRLIIKTKSNIYFKSKMIVLVLRARTHIGYSIEIPYMTL